MPLAQHPTQGSKSFGAILQMLAMRTSPPQLRVSGTRDTIFNPFVARIIACAALTAADLRQQAALRATFHFFHIVKEHCPYFRGHASVPTHIPAARRCTDA
jgi:hypothetical protein